MAQQGMQFEDARQSEEKSKSYESGYEVPPSYSNDYDTSSYNQKITGQGKQNSSDNVELRKHVLNLRMGMAITSLVLWIGLFLIALSVLYNTSIPFLIQPFTIIGMIVFTIMVIFANLMLNRKPM
jgi:hypothetical protein